MWLYCGKIIDADIEVLWSTDSDNIAGCLGALQSGHVGHTSHACHLHSFQSQADHV